MPRIAHVLIIPRRAGQPECVVSPAGVLHDLDQRFLIHGPVFRGETGFGVEPPRYRSGGRGVDIALDALVQRAEREGLEVRTLAALHVEHLDELAPADLVALGISGQDVDDPPKRIGQRVRRLEPALAQPQVRRASHKG